MQDISDIVQASKDVVVCRDCFAKLSSYLEKINEIFNEVHDIAPEGISALQIIIQPLETELKNAKELIRICTSKSKFYLLLNCRAYVKRVEDIVKSVGLALSQIPLDNLQLSVKSKNKLNDLCEEMQGAQLKPSMAEEGLVDELDLSLRDRRKDTDQANNLLFQIAKLAGVSSNPSSIKLEFEELKREKESVEEEKYQKDIIQLEQIVSLLSCADAANSVTEREKQYREKRRGLGNHALQPLQTFYCPITQDVMENPVEIASGHTFEMSAIQKWFAEGHNVCPVTKMELHSLGLKPNRLLRESIEEWKDRNTVIKLASMACKLKSENEDEITEALLELQALCDEKSVHRYWIAAEGLIPVLVGLLKSSKRDLRKKAFSTLITLTTDNKEIKDKICDAGAIDYAVRSLARDPGEARQAVALLLELSKDENLCEKISKAQGCILLLVTMSNSQNTHAASDAKEILRLFSKSNENVKLMAEVNYFQPLVQCLDEGSVITQVLMANALSQMQLTDQGRALLVQGGVLAPLVRMVSTGNLEAKSAALGAFQNLSSLRENRDPMIKAGVVQPLLELLFTVKSIVTTVREHAAATLANLAMYSDSSGIRDLWGNSTEPDDTMFQLLSLLSLTGPNIQCHILRVLTCICRHSQSVDLRATLRGGGSIQLLVRLIDTKDLEVRLHALNFLHCLTQDGGGELLAEEMGQDSFQILVGLLSSESSEEEKAAAMGILGNLPIHNRKVTQMLLDARLLPSIVTILMRYCSKVSGNAMNTALVENATWTLIRFTLRSDVQLQQLAAEHDVIPLLVNLLGSGTPLIKSRAAMSLEQFSESTITRSVPIKRSSRWFCCNTPAEPACPVHSGLCSVKGTFCLLEADAVPALIQNLEEREDEINEAALGALATLVYDECCEKGSNIIEQAQGILPIIRKLSSPSSGVQEKALWILERIFRKENYRTQYGGAAQMSLVSVTQNGTNATRPLAAKILAHLNILHDQSSYF